MVALLYVSTPRYRLGLPRGSYAAGALRWWCEAGRGSDVHRCRRTRHCRSSADREICLAVGVRRAAPPRGPELPARLERGKSAALSHDASFTETELTGASLVDQHARGLTFETAKLAGVDLSGSRLEHLRIVDAVLDGCNLANVQGRGARLSRVVVKDSRLTGIDLSEGVLTDVTFQGCRVDLASFSSRRLERVTFEDCVLAQTDFLEARLDSVGFHGCDLTNADLRGARLERCELRRSDLTGLQGVASLRGAAMEWPDIVEMAGVWATALGIEVLDSD
ncbi:MAG TPA: pentapeptide repeat-containing protein [Solirubrobacteraceae bacterium]|nr:pentapeptide repeat-containing protein [Solirubrobacteraceae bacterium]